MMKCLAAALPIRPLDFVRLRHTPHELGIAVLIEDNQVLVEFVCNINLGVSWVPLEFLELVPDANEELLAA